MPKGAYSEDVHNLREKNVSESDACEICGGPAIKTCRHICMGYSLNIRADVECKTLLCGGNICEEEHKKTSALHIL
jgi:hypothetical protein